MTGKTGYVHSHDVHLHMVTNIWVTIQACSTHGVLQYRRVPHTVCHMSGCYHMIGLSYIQVFPDMSTFSSFRIVSRGIFKFSKNVRVFGLCQ